MNTFQLLAFAEELNELGILLTFALKYKILFYFAQGLNTIPCLLGTRIFSPTWAALYDHSPDAYYFSRTSFVVSL